MVLAEIDIFKLLFIAILAAFVAALLCVGHRNYRGLWISIAAALLLVILSGLLILDLERVQRIAQKRAEAKQLTHEANEEDASTEPLER